MRKFIALAAVTTALASGLTSCDNDDYIMCCHDKQEDKTCALTIQTDIQTRSTVWSFPEKSSLGLFVTAGSVGKHYNGKPENANVQSMYSGGVWQQTPKVYLNSSPATIFAYYPYAKTEGEATSIHVEHYSQTDYMYGTHSKGQKSVDSKKPVAKLTMNHALSLVQFRFRKENYEGPGLLTKIEIANSEGKKALSSKGRMDVVTGDIVPTEGANDQANLTNPNMKPILSIDSEFSSEELCFPSLMVLPNKKTQEDGEIVIRFFIDEKLYTWNVPTNTLWQKGKKNTYSVTLKGTILTVGDVDIAPWAVGEAGSVDLMPV